MSGFVVILNTDREPVSESLLAQMTQSMAFRGSDEQQTVAIQNVGLGCALLRTTNESRHEKQPFSLDSRCWIVGDVRLDGRSDLIREFPVEERTHLQQASDIELLLHAYHRWGDTSVEHLMGDFAFAIWDSREHRLFCARDHIGIRPLFYAHLNGLFILGNTLNALRLHPKISGELNEAAIGDFLLFHMQYDLRATVFRDLARVPPAHTLSLSRGAIALRRYWTLATVAERPRMRRRQYLEEFDELLCKAVGDRLRTARVSVLMSGGMDSPTLAAIAHRLMCARGQVDSVRAFCAVYTGMFDDPERKFAEIAARHLGIPLEFIFVADGARLYQPWDDPQFNTPEPFHNPLLGIVMALRRALVSQGRVVLDGFDGDDLLRCDFDFYLRMQLQSGNVKRLFSDFCAYTRVKLSDPGPGMGTWLRHRRSRRLRRLSGPFRDYPPWLNPAFERRCGMRERWHEIYSCNRQRQLYPGIHYIFSHPNWPALMDEHDAAFTGLPSEYRHPFCDLRIIKFCMGVPPIPWHIHKLLLRELMRDVLPDEILARRKTPLVAEPVSILLERDGRGDLASLKPALENYVAVDVVPHETGGSPDDLLASLTPMSLGLWLTRNGNQAKRGAESSF
jgi:asparagine synthase (glutamine-hydrolysing)